MTPLPKLIGSLNSHVAAALGHPLHSVIYRAFENECTAEHVAAGIGWFGGEVELRFGALSPFFVTWGENEGWSDHFSLLIQANSAFHPGALVPFSAMRAPEWVSYVGQPLLCASCLGSAGTPHVLTLRFVTGAVVIGVGHEGDFGDGDNVIIKPQLVANLGKFTECFWESGDTGI